MTARLEVFGPLCKATFATHSTAADADALRIAASVRPDRTPDQV